jgi:hypothetical protein
MHASDEYIRRALELALEYDVALRLTAHGDVEVLGRLGASPREATVPEQEGLPQPSPAVVDAVEPTPVRQVKCLVGEGFQLQRAIRRQDLVPKKCVAYEMAVSETTLWRALKSDLPDFPQPVVIRKKVYWRRADLPALEDALMYFQGRGVFERQRKAPSQR